MKTIVDSCVWSLALRKRNKTENDEVAIERLNQIILQNDVVMIGAIRQEVLSGIRHDEQFKKLKTRLSIFEDLPVTTHDHELASYYFNQCRKQGIQGSSIDFLICAVAISHKLPIFTLDKDFEHYQKVLDIRLI